MYVLYQWQCFLTVLSVFHSQPRLSTQPVVGFLCDDVNLFVTSFFVLFFFDRVLPLTDSPHIQFLFSVPFWHISFAFFFLYPHFKLQGVCFRVSVVTSVIALESLSFACFSFWLSIQAAGFSSRPWHWRKAFSATLATMKAEGANERRHGLQRKTMLMW